MFYEFDVEAWHENGTNMEINERKPLAQAIKNESSKDIFEDFDPDELYKMINVKTDPILLSRTSEYNDAWSEMTNAVKIVAKANPRIVFEIKITTTDANDMMNGTEYIRYHGSETEFHKSTENRGPFTKILKENDPYGRNDNLIDLHINGKTFIISATSNIDNNQFLIITESIRNMLHNQAVENDYDIANIIKTVLHNYKIGGEVLLPTHSINISNTCTIATTERHPIRPAEIREQYVAAKLWEREDIYHMLTENNYEGTDNEIDAVINTHMLDALEDCTDTDWEIIENAISYAEKCGNIHQKPDPEDD